MKRSIELDDEHLAAFPPEIQNAFWDIWRLQQEKPKPNRVFQGLPLKVVGRHNARESEMRLREIQSGEGVNMSHLFKGPKRGNS